MISWQGPGEPSEDTGSAAAKEHGNTCAGKRGTRRDRTGLLSVVAKPLGSSIALSNGVLACVHPAYSGTSPEQRT